MLLPVAVGPDRFQPPKANAFLLPLLHPRPSDGLLYGPHLLSPHQEPIFSHSPVGPRQRLHKFFSSKTLFQSIHYLHDKQKLLIQA